MRGLFPLHPHQIRALDMLKASIRAGKKRPMLHLSTGAGKTIIATHIIAGALEKGNKVVFTVPMVNLIDQSFERFTQQGIDPYLIGVQQSDHEWSRPGAPIQICSVATLERRGFPQADIYLIDEAHIKSAKFHAFLASNGMQPQSEMRAAGGDAGGWSLPLYPETAKTAPRLAIGLSATPFAAGLGRVFDDLICPVTMRELIASGHLSDFRVYAPSHPDLSGVKIDAKSGDYQTGELSSCMSKPKIVADVVENWLANGPGRKTLCFAVDRAHAAVLHDEFEKSGVASAYMDANTPREERRDIISKYARDEIKVICNIGVLTTGFDSDVRCLIFARPTKSESLFVQIIGRGLRTADGKDFVTIYDHTNTHQSLGMVTDITIGELDTSKPGAGDAKRKKKTIPMPLECLACGCLVPAGDRECPSCGAVMKRASSVVVEDGELVELGDKAKKGRTNTVTQMLAELPKAELFGQLKGMQREYGWKDGKISYAFRDIHGVWPNKYRHVLPIEPTNLLRSWMRAKAIAFAKSKAAEKIAMHEAAD